MVRQPGQLTKILVIIPSGFCFGLQNVTLDFFKNFSVKTIPYFLNTYWTDGEFPKRVKDLGYGQSFTWFGMFSRKMDRKNLKMSLECFVHLPLMWFQFLKVYRRTRPDVLFFANTHELILLSPILFWLKRKVVCHVHDPPPAIPFQKGLFFLWKSVTGRFIFISRDVERRFKLLGKPKSISRVIYNGVQVKPRQSPIPRSATFAERYSWPANCIIVGITGQMSVNKGHLDFVRAASISSEQNHMLRFVIGGKPVHPFVEEIRKNISAYNLDPIFSFSGWAPTASEFYENLDIFVLASKHDEGFGLVVAEAMSLEVPVIATCSGGAAEIIENNISGYLIEKSNPTLMAEKILLLANDANLRVKVGKAGKARIEKGFNIKNQALELEKFLRE